MGSSQAAPGPRAPQEARTTSEQGRRRTPASRAAGNHLQQRARPASLPSAPRFMSTLVSGGRVASVITSQLSKPTTATSAGHGEAHVSQRVDRAAGDLIVAAETARPVCRRA